MAIDSFLLFLLTETGRNASAPTPTYECKQFERFSLLTTYSGLWIFNTLVAAANPDFARFICFLSLTVFQSDKILSLIASFSKSLLTQLSVAGN